MSNRLSLVAVWLALLLFIVLVALTTPAPTQASLATATPHWDMTVPQGPVGPVYIMWQYVCRGQVRIEAIQTPMGETLQGVQCVEVIDPPQQPTPREEVW